MSEQPPRKKSDKPTRLEKKESPEGNRRELDRELDRLEARIEEVRVLFEQHFIDVLPQPPTKAQAEIVREIKRLLKAPFKIAATRFRLRTLIHRYQTYNTYWERVQKLREEGKYSRDVFKAELREKMLEDARREESKLGRAEKGIRQLYDTYENAMKKAGGNNSRMDFDAFKSSLMKKAKLLKEKHGVKKLNYKVVLKDGKVVIKASSKS
ncbi:MAG: hypothetical protein IT290_09575 [Deltaproteobacteria bacterium]|nr:hypothetical protein [Deltaproteobacteria bacterium]